MPRKVPHLMKSLRSRESGSLNRSITMKLGECFVTAAAVLVKYYSRLNTEYQSH